ncbi:N-terminal fungal transcription regulatory domain-containing protein [Diaporthe sp. PMI_573]|nr:N-terminal fungal transcription regulatory domain-containing protein [Diaporthaceae sp. PMI_573]
MGPHTTASVSCGRCRSRRVKCDRRKPECERCLRGSDSCPGYIEGLRFQDEGPRLRKQFDKTTGAVRQRTPTRSGPSATPPNDVIASSPVPSPADNVRSSPLGSDSGTVDPTVSGAHTASGHDTIRNVSNLPPCDFFEDAFFDLDIDQYYAQGNNSCGFVPNPDDIALQSDIVAECNTDPQEVDVGAFNQDAIALDWLLMRHYINVISPWLDVFSADKYFGHVVPVKASRSILLKNTVSAVAAKQIGNAGFCGQTSSWQRTGFGVDEVRFSTSDWLYHAASFYDKAVRCMLHRLQSIGRLLLPQEKTMR